MIFTDVRTRGGWNGPLARRASTRRQNAWRERRSGSGISASLDSSRISARDGSTCHRLSRFETFARSWYVPETSTPAEALSSALNQSSACLRQPPDNPPLMGKHCCRVRSRPSPRRERLGIDSPWSGRLRVPATLQTIQPKGEPMHRTGLERRRSGQTMLPPRRRTGARLLPQQLAAVLPESTTPWRET